VPKSQWKTRSRILSEAMEIDVVQHPHVAAGYGYACDVVAGNIPACEYVRQACQRHLDDLKKAAGGWAYYFDHDAAEKVCKFTCFLPHIKGPLAGKNLSLEPWQSFILTVAFGWLRHDNGKRRFRRAYIEVPRGNGKTTLARLLAAQMPAMAGEMTATGKMNVGYFTQYQVEELDTDDTPLEHMTRSMRGAWPASRWPTLSASVSAIPMRWSIAPTCIACCSMRAAPAG